MVLDCFYYNGEKEVLQVRLETLNAFVDYFIICEYDLTFSGKPKPLYFQEHKDLFAKYNHKIIYHRPIFDKEGKSIYDKNSWYHHASLLSPNTGKGEHYWIREWIQKEALREVLEKGCKPDDFIYISDVDEIWNPMMKLDMTKDVVYKPKQTPYLYYFNQRTDENWLGWSGTIAFQHRRLSGTQDNPWGNMINHLRTDDLTDYVVVENGGWHFNSIGGKAKKKEAFAHPIYDDEGVWYNREINMRKDETGLPPAVLNKKDVWTSLFL